MVLRREQLGEDRRIKVDADHAPGPESRFQHVVGEFGLMTAMEGADADMGHADAKLCPVVARPSHGSGELQK